MPPTPKSPAAPVLSVNTLLVFQELLANLTLNVAAPDFEEKAIAVAQAKREIIAALKAADEAA